MLRNLKFVAAGGVILVALYLINQVKLEFRRETNGKPIISEGGLAMEHGAQQYPEKARDPDKVGLSGKGNHRNEEQFDLLLRQYCEIPIGDKYFADFNQITRVLVKRHTLPLLGKLETLRTSLTADQFLFLLESLGSELGRQDANAGTNSMLGLLLSASLEDLTLRDKLLANYALALSFHGKGDGTVITKAIELLPDDSTRASVLLGFISKLEVERFDSTILDQVLTSIPAAKLDSKALAMLADKSVKSGNALHVLGLANQDKISKLQDSVVFRWFQEDTNVCLEYLSTQKANPKYNKWIDGLIPHLAKIDPEAAQVWAKTISDPKLRADALKFAVPF
jgi:hypothetical protein